MTPTMMQSLLDSTVHVIVLLHHLYIAHSLEYLSIWVFLTAVSGYLKQFQRDGKCRPPHRVSQWTPCSSWGPVVLWGKKREILISSFCFYIKHCMRFMHLADTFFGGFTFSSIWFLCESNPGLSVLEAGMLTATLWEHVPQMDKRPQALREHWQWIFSSSALSKNNWSFYQKKGRTQSFRTIDAVRTLTCFLHKQTGRFVVVCESASKNKSINSVW